MLDFKGFWNLKDPRVYVLLIGALLLLCGGLGSLPVGNKVLSIRYPIVFSVFGVAIVVAGVVAILLRPAAAHDNVAKGTLTFGLTDILLDENAKDLQVDYKSLTTIDALLDNIYYEIRSEVTPGTYGETWIIRKRNEEPLRLLGKTWAQFFNKVGKDDRRPGDVGMKPSMHFEVKRLKQPLFLINVDPNGGSADTIMEIGYTDAPTVDGLLNRIGDSLIPRQTSSTYGDEWFLRDVATGDRLNGIGPEWARLHEKDRDNRSLPDAGIAKNKRLEVRIP